MSEPIKHLLNHLVEMARARGMSQAELARRAGMTAVGLSKAKARGDIRASSLARLADALGMELALRPRRSREQAVAAIRAGRFFRAAEPARRERKR